MPLADYFEVFWLQSETPREDDFWGIIWEMGDALKIMGGLSKAKQAEIRVAEAQGLAAQYDFITDIRLPLGVNYTIRRESNNTYYRISGLPEKSPEPAESKFQVLPVVLTTREAASRGDPP